MPKASYPHKQKYTFRGVPLSVLVLAVRIKPVQEPVRHLAKGGKHNYPYRYNYSQNSFYYFYGILVLTYRLRLIALSSSIWISCVRQLHTFGFPKYISKLKARLNSSSDGTVK